MYDDVNKRICDRDNCFYWQTDRKISSEEAAMIWKDRHSPIKNEAVLKSVNNCLKGNKLLLIEPFDENAKTSFGSVNSIRVGVLESGDRVIIRCHPKGIRNGYYYVESLAASTALKYGIPSYHTYLIHDLEENDDISYQVIEMLPFDTVQFYLKEHPDAEEKLVFEMGKMLSHLHKIKVKGFGPFFNEEAKNGNLVGRFSSLRESICAGLDENLDRLVKYNILSSDIVDKIKSLFNDNPLFDYEDSVLIHNDFADWNLLTDGKSITGVLDWDECVGGHPIQEIACWSTFFEPDRIQSFLKGYYSEKKMDDNYLEYFQLFRLRYTLSKMALRVKRYSYEQTDFLKGMIEKGQKHLDELFLYFHLNDKDVVLKK